MHSLGKVCVNFPLSPQTGLYSFVQNRLQSRAVEAAFVVAMIRHVAINKILKFIFIPIFYLFDLTSMTFQLILLQETDNQDFYSKELT
jgi:hypothetical protein